MKQVKNAILLILILAVVIIAAVLGYGYLTRDYDSEESQTQPVQPVQAPDFTVIDESGARVSLSNFKGKPVIVNFWATWCGPCKEELPYFDSAYQLYGEQVQFIMLNVDGGYETVEKAKEFARQNGYSFPLYFDAAYDASRTYGINAIPVTLCISPDGEIVWSKIGMLTENELISQIRKMTGAE